MIKGIDVNQKIEFTSKSDKDEVKTIFVFQPITGIEFMSIKEFGAVSILDKAIVEIRNYSPEQPKIDFIKSLPIDVITELMEQATKINNITVDDRKNS